MESCKIFYIYFYLRKIGTPYYVGKGKENRAYEKDHCVVVPKDLNRILLVNTELDELTAFAMERFWIKLYGRKDLNTGILRNQTDGGDGASNPSQKTRKKLSDALKGRKSPMSGKNHKKSSKKKISASVKKSYIGRTPLRLGKINIYGKQITTPFRVFNSGKHAASVLKLTYRTIMYRVSIQKDGWNYC